MLYKDLDLIKLVNPTDRFYNRESFDLNEVRDTPQLFEDKSVELEKKLKAESQFKLHLTSYVSYFRDLKIKHIISNRVIVSKQFEELELGEVRLFGLVPKIL